MESPSSISLHQKFLPLPPVSEPPSSQSTQYTKRDGQYFLPERSAARPQRAQLDGEESSRNLQIRAVKEHNKALKKELTKNHRLQIIGEKLADEVQSSADRLKHAVLAFRREQKAIDAEFLRNNQV